MFTGIVQHLGKVVEFQPHAFGAALAVDASNWNHHPALGESIAVNGCCLTVTARQVEAANLCFDIIRQTLDVTTLGELQAGNAVNLEHAVTPQTMLGGHIVQGHIDGIGEVRSMTRSDAEHRLRIAPREAALMECIVERSSIALDGVSLTVAATGTDWFEVALIPTTLQLTNLGALKQGSRINLETDYLAKAVVNYLRRRDTHVQSPEV